jgi:hypothetical protein
LGTIVLMERMQKASKLQHLSNAQWAQWELAGTTLPDERLRKRLRTMLTDLASAPAASLPKACVSWDKIKAAYRFLADDQLTPEQLLAGHRQATLQRLQQEPVVLAVQDTTTLNYTTHAQTQGLGHTTRAKTRGLFLHSTIAFTTTGLPLGILQGQMWSRDRPSAGGSRQRNGKPLEQKESRKWLESLAALAALAGHCPNCRLVSVADREGDLYELLAAAQMPGAPAVLIRAQHNRQVAGQEPMLLVEHISAQPAAATVEIALPRRPGVAARRARCQIRFGAVSLQAPLLKEQQPALAGIYFIEVREIGVAAEQAIEWRLLTTLPVSSVEQALEKVRWYLVRWQIEVFHRTLKSGCAVEGLQLETLARLQRAIALKMIVAWRVMALAQCSRGQAGQASASVLLAPEEIEVLLAVTKTQATAQSLTLRQAVRAVAGLGGFLGRKGDGEPGVFTLWRGLQRLHDMTAAALALKIVGNG